MDRISSGVRFIKRTTKTICAVPFAAHKFKAVRRISHDRVEPLGSRREFR